jgi:hypothetical protein
MISLGIASIKKWSFQPSINQSEKRNTILPKNPAGESKNHIMLKLDTYRMSYLVLWERNNKPLLIYGLKHPECPASQEAQDL